MFDYIVYVIYMTFEKKRIGHTNSLFLASSFVFMLQFLIAMEIIYAIDTFTDGMVLKDVLSNNYELIKVGFVIAIALFSFVYYKHYRKKIGFLLQKYKNHPANKWFKPWMLVALAVLLVFSPALWGYLHSL